MRGLADQHEAILNGGIHDGHSASERMRIRLSNRVAVSDLVTALLCLPIFSLLMGRATAAIILLAFVPNFSPLWLNRQGRYRLARAVSIVSTCVMFTGLSVLLGEECRLEVAFAATLCGTMVLLPPDEPRRRLLFALPIVSVVAVWLIRALVPVDGLVPVEHRGMVFGVILLLTLSNVLDRLKIILGEAERRRQLLSEAHREALQASEAKSVFLTHMSHELRTPLAGIIGLTDLALPAAPDDDQRELLQQSRRSAEHLLGLLGGVLDLARIEAGSMQLEITDFDLNACIDDALALVRPQAESRGVRLKEDVSVPAPCWCRGDPLRLRQILVNLLGNSIKFTEKGAVTLSAVLDERLLRVRIEDTGIGMTAEQAAAIFTPFYQAEASTTRRFGGTGLGLSITRQLVDLFEGTIGCDSEPGVGTVFSVTLPLPVGEPPEPVALPAEQELPRGLRVLVAEDHVVNQLVIRRTLELLGQDVRVVETGRAALMAARKERWDLILMDVQMPDMDGLTATRLLREEGYDGLIIALTANTMREDIVQCREAGMDDVLIKPAARASLLQVLARCRPESEQRARGHQPWTPQRVAPRQA